MVNRKVQFLYAGDFACGNLDAKLTQFTEFTA
jgi:hypothetical protein